VALNPQEIQVGILKRLRGTPIVRHDDVFKMRYSEDPPYEVVSTKEVSFKELQEMGRFARYWDLVANSGNFLESRERLLATHESPFQAFFHFSSWLFLQVGKRSSINLKTLAELVFAYLTNVRGGGIEDIGPIVARDYERGGRSDLPRVLAPYASSHMAVGERVLALKRQQRTLLSQSQGVGE
jgi:hypothetical protein